MPGRAPAVRRLCAAVLVIALSAAAILAGTAATSETKLAGQVFRATGLRGGLIVHLGCGDGRLTAALCGPSYVVHGLDTDAGHVALARQRLERLGVYGPVSVERFDGRRLPYAENLVNLVVAEDAAGVAHDEVMRVLAPGGTLYAREGGAWQKTVKPRPANIDQWTHYAYDASNNPVAHDDVVGPPGRIQWTEGPRHTRSHEHLPGLCALVSAGGRIFYIQDEAPTASLRFAPRWRLVARDAFNGVLLWERAIDTWYPHLAGWTQAPNQLQRRLVAVGDRVFVTLGLHAPLSELDAASGKTIRVFEGTQGAEEILWHKGRLLVVVQAVTPERTAEIARWKELVAQEKSPLQARETGQPFVQRLKQIETSGPKTIVAMEADSGRLAWKNDAPELDNLKAESLAAGGDRVFYQAGPDAVCVGLAAGREQWRSRAPLRLVSGDRVLCAGNEKVTVLSADSGQEQWSRDSGFCQILDTFVVGRTLWVGGLKPFNGMTSGKRGAAWGPYFAAEFSLDSGEVLKRVEPENPGHHHRCYRSKATDRYIVGGRRGTEFIDMASGDVLWNSWARGVCRYGVMPCNGLLYTPPHACGCYVTAKLTGFNAMAARPPSDGQPPRPAPDERLERGPACSDKHPAAEPSAWPTYRADAARSGFTKAAVPARLQRRWQTPIGGRLTACTAGAGKVFVASADQHAVCAIDAGSGQCVWRFTAGARVDSPPTLCEGRALFGSRDGCLYSLRAADGALAWRLRAARQERRIVANGQLESAWPAHGAVLVAQGTAYVTAGRSSYLDGGIDLCRVDTASGRLLSTTPLYSPDAQTGRQPPHLAPAVMVGARSDLLSSSDNCVYLRDQVFDLQAQPLPEGHAHLFTLTDYLDDSWAHRSYWIFGRRASLATGCSTREKNLVYGRLLVFDPANVYGYGRAKVHWSDQFEDGPYRVFAVEREGGMQLWEKRLPLQVRAMLLAGRVLFVAGAMSEPIAKPEEPRPSVLVALSADDGSELAQYPLDAPPVFDGLAAAAGRLYASLENGQLLCMEGVGKN